MSYSQEIYDAARSRISPMDSSAIERVARDAFDISHIKAIAQQEVAIVGREWARPSVLFRPSLCLDGNMYCALYGEDLMNGCAGFGETAHLAMEDFDQNWWKQKAPQARKSA